MRLRVLAPAALCSAQLWLLGSADIFRRNVGEFEYSFSNSLMTLALVALLQFIVTGGLGIALSKTARSRYQVLLMSLGVLLWTQASFLVWDYGVFDGKPIDWSQYRHLLWIDLLLWSAVLVATQRYRDRVDRLIVVVPLGLIVLQCAMLGFDARRLFASHDDQLELDELMGQFSKNQNIVHIVMDGFHSDSFRKQLDEHGWAKEFEGFTFYEDNLAPSALTALSLPAIFSGDIYDGSVPPGRYHERSMGERGFQNLLFDHGWRVHLVPKVNMSAGKYHTHAITPTGYGTTTVGRQRDQALLLADLALFRSVPAILRPSIFREGEWFLSRLFGAATTGSAQVQRAFFDEFVRSIQPQSDEPVYNFIHLMPPHPPFSTLDDGSYAGRVLEHTQANYEIEARYTLTSFVEMLRTLKALNLYESTLIILQADHGYGFNKDDETKDDRRYRPRAAALLAIKLPGEREALRISRAPTSSADVASTVLKYVRIPHALAGTPVDELESGQERERLYTSYAGQSTHGNAVRRFVVRGPIRDAESWDPVEVRPIQFGQPTYAWGDLFSFRLGDDVEQYLGNGWCPRSVSGCRRSCARRAELGFLVEPSNAAITLELEISPYLELTGQTQNLRLHCNGQFIGKAVLDDSGRRQLRIVIPAGMAADGRLDLSFRMPDAVSSHEGGGRRHSICLHSLRMTPVGG